MSAEQTPDIETTLRRHQLVGANIWAAECSCGQQEGVDYYTHVAQVLAAAVREAEQRALREAADWVAAGGTPASVEGSSWLAMVLRERADRVAEPQHEEGVR